MGNYFFKKQAALFESALHVGAIIGGAKKEEQQAFSTYGHHLGCIFQLSDDFLDYFGTKNSLGKNAGDDFYEGKITLPALLAYKAGTDDEKSFWTRIFGKTHVRTALDFTRARIPHDQASCARENASQHHRDRSKSTASDCCSRAISL